MLPTEVLGMWEQFVDACEQGYDWSIYEYDNDILVRDLIQTLLGDPRLVTITQMSWFRERVTEIDNRFKALSVAGPVVRPEAPWWRARVPAYAGPELAADLESRYGVIINVSE
jgi:hypothetical protein